MKYKSILNVFMRAVNSTAAWRCVCCVLVSIRNSEFEKYMSQMMHCMLSYIRPIIAVYTDLRWNLWLERIYFKVGDYIWTAPYEYIVIYAVHSVRDQSLFRWRHITYSTSPCPKTKFKRLFHSLKRQLNPKEARHCFVILPKTSSLYIDICCSGTC